MSREGDELYGELQDAEVLITTPFWPVYVTPEVMDQAPNLKLILTAGVGSDDVDLGEAANRNITVAEQTAANVVSVAEHAAMCILNLARNFVLQYNQVTNGEWDIAGIAKKAYDLGGKTSVSTARRHRAAGRYAPERFRPQDVLLQALAPLQRRGGGLRFPIYAPRRHEGHLAEYAGDVWDPEPAPSDHPW